MIIEKTNDSCPRFTEYLPNNNVIEIDNEIFEDNYDYEQEGSYATIYRDDGNGPFYYFKEYSYSDSEFINYVNKSMDYLSKGIRDKIISRFSNTSADDLWRTFDVKITSDMEGFDLENEIKSSKEKEFLRLSSYLVACLYENVEKVFYKRT